MFSISWFSNSKYCSAYIPPPCTQQGPLYSACCDQILLFYPLTTFVWFGCTCRPLLVRLCATPHHQTKENYFVCLFAVAPFLTMVWVLSFFFLPIPHGMHLVILTQFCSFGWCVIPAGHFPQKSPRRNLKIGFSPLPIAKPCPLTSDPWPHRVLYWLGTGWWGLGLARASLPCMSKICMLLMCLPWLACTVCRLFLTIF